MKKIYISAPIVGYNISERNKFFADMAKVIKDMGFIPVNPMEKADENQTRQEHLREDTKLLLDCNEIWVFGDFINSSGCMYEIEVARQYGIKIRLK